MGCFAPRLRATSVLVAALFVPVLSAFAQDLNQARRTVERLASAGFHGRGYVKRGERRAAQYIRQNFVQLGLAPLAPGYFQPFPLDVNTFPGKFTLQVGGQPLRPGADFIAEPNSGSGRLSGPAVYLDTLIFSSEAAGQRFLADSLRGRILVLRQRDAERLRTLPAAFEQAVGRAAARIILISGKLTASVAQQQVTQVRLHVLAGKWPAATGQAVRLSVDAVLRRAYPTQNVAALVRGSAQPDSFLVVTAHYDHLGRMGREAYFPGANDNASGTALLLALAAHYARPENRPRYSVAFVAFGAEEVGLIGSRYFVEHPLLPLARIRFLLNLDLEGTGQAGATVVNGRLHEVEYRFLTRLNEQGNYLPELAARGRAANSDHYPFSEAGVPAFFLYTRGTPSHYHDVHDRAATLPLTGFSGVFQLVTQFFAQLSGKPR